MRENQEYQYNLDVIGEYNAHRSEMISYHEDLSRYERFAVTGIFVIYGVFVSDYADTNEPEYIFRNIYLLGSPFFISCLFIVILNSFKLRIVGLACYLHYREEQMGLEPGWEKFVWSARLKDAPYRQRLGTNKNLVDEKNYIREALASKDWTRLSDNKLHKVMRNYFSTYWTVTQSRWTVTAIVSGFLVAAYSFINRIHINLESLTIPT